jgi:hypothetical protein
MGKNCGIYAKNNYESYDRNFNGSTKRIYLNSNPNSLSVNAETKFYNKYASKMQSNSGFPIITSLNITNENPSKSFYNYNIT